MKDSNLNPVANQKRFSRPMILVTILVGLMLFCGIAVLLAVPKAWERMVRLDCDCQLRQLGVPCRQYAAAHEGHFPSTWKELNFVREDANWEKLLRCPQTHHEVGIWEQVDLWADYRLLPGRSTNDPPNTVLALEPLSNHGAIGANVLFVDGSTEWWSALRLLGLTKQRISDTNTPDGH